MIRPRPFRQIDVFTSIPFLGNPVAVVLDGAGLGDEAMQRFARWTNLSETTFVMPATDPAADYAVRIWTPVGELPFAGHPTLGTAHAVLAAGIAAPRSGVLVQQCAAGLIPITVPGEGTGQELSFRLPHYHGRAAPDVTAVAAMIGGAAITGTPMIFDVGPHWVIAELASADDVMAVTPDYRAMAAYLATHGGTGLTIFAPSRADDSRDVVVRSFVPDMGGGEDPVCGSGNGAVAAYRMMHGMIGDGSAYTARQGAAMGRDGFVRVRIAGSDIHIGGACVGCIDGVALL